MATFEDIENGDTLQAIFESVDPFVVDFVSDEDTEEARRGIESLGVAFKDLSNAGERDMEARFDDGQTSFDYELKATFQGV